LKKIVVTLTILLLLLSTSASAYNSRMSGSNFHNRYDHGYTQSESNFHNRYDHGYTHIGYENQNATSNVDFSATPTSGNAPLTVQFNDLSTANTVYRLWDFGDGSTSTLQNPAHVYTEAGRYTATLTVTNTEGSNLGTKSDYIFVAASNPPVDTSSITTSSVTTPSDTTPSVATPSDAISPVATPSIATPSVTTSPIATFTASTTSGDAPLTVAFTDTSTGSPTSWAWNFGDGAVSTNQSPTHIFETAGTFTITLTASNVNGGNSTSAQIVVSSTVIPVPVATSTTPVTTGTESDDNNSNNCNNCSSNNCNNNNCNSTNCTDSNYTNLKPYCSVSTMVPTNLKVLCSGKAPHQVNFIDRSEKHVSWYWDFGDGKFSSCKNTLHTYKTPGKYLVKLTVRTTGHCTKTIYGGYIVVEDSSPQTPIELTPTPAITSTPTPTITPTPTPTITPTPTSTPADRSNSVYISYLYVGAPDQTVNQEYVQITNTGTTAINLNGWTITDEGAKHVYTFPSYSLLANSMVTLYTGNGTNTATKLYWGMGSHIWNNTGDKAFLYDVNGNLVSSINE
jgi:PKD repeat protein